MTDKQGQVDWNRLCNAPGIIFVQRWFIGVGATVAAAALIWLAATFGQMRDATRDLTTALHRIEETLADQQGRIRDLERTVDHYGAPTPGRR